MNKMYQRLKRKCISLVLFALLVAFIVPYYAYAADNGAEPAAAASAAAVSYTHLNEQQKKEDAVQKAFQILSKAETKLKDAKTADNVVQAIKALGEIATLDSEEDIESVRAAYELSLIHI